MHDYQTSASLTKIKSFNCLRLIKSMESVLLYFLILQNLLTCKDNSSVLIMAEELAICWNVAFEEDDHQEYLLYSGQSINLPPCKAKFLNVPESYFAQPFSASSFFTSFPHVDTFCSICTYNFNP